MKPKVLVFASGSKDGGGSGFLHLILNMLAGILPVEIVGVVSNHEHGGVRKIADQYGIRFFLLKSFETEVYRLLVAKTGAEWFLLSGWLKKICGLSPAHTINIHPGPLPDFGGPGMYGHHVHQAVLDAGVEFSAVTMHFVTGEYDRGPTFFKYPIPVIGCQTADELGARVNRYEHGWQSEITWLVVSGQISWSGRKEEEVQAPDWYRLQSYCPDFQVK